MPDRPHPDHPAPTSEPARPSARELLEGAETVAVVGASPDRLRASHSILGDLLAHGYRAVPIHPVAREIHGVPVQRSLASVDAPIDLVVLFRNPAAVPAHVEEALAVGARAIWMQPGAVNDEAARRARDVGVPVVAGECVARMLFAMRSSGDPAA